MPLEAGLGGVSNSDGELNVGLGQERDANNSQTVTSSEASPGTPWIGDWTETRDEGYVRLLTVVAATDPEIPGTFTFELTDSSDPSTDHPTLGTAEISESFPIEDFDTVRDFDLNNAGAAYYRVAFEPDNALGGDSVIVTTTLRKQDDGTFARLATQEIEEANALLGSQFVYSKAFDPFTGKSKNVRAGSPDPNNSSTTLLGAGATFTGSMVGHHKHGFVGSVVFVKSNEPGTLTLIHSESGTDPDFDNRTVTLSYDPTIAPQGIPYHIPAWSEYFKVKFQNTGASTQTQFSLQTHHSPVGFQPAALPVAQGVSDATLASVNKAILEAANDSGGYGQIERSDDGGLRISIYEQEAEIQQKSLSTVSSAGTNVGTSATQLDSSKLDDRKYVTIGNAGSKTVYYRPNAPSMTVGIPIPPDSAIQEEWNDDIDVWCASSSGTQAVWIIQHGGTI